MEKTKKPTKKVRLYMHSINAARTGVQVFHGYTLNLSDIYGQDESGYFVFNVNSIGYDESGKAVAMLNRLYNNSWIQVIYTDATKAPVFAEIARKYGLYEMRYQKSNENAKELRSAATGKDPAYRYIKQRGTKAREPKFTKEYNTASQKIYGEYIYFGDKKRKVSGSIASYMDGVMKK